jgi:ABC-type phosphonate transport system ATPase subunit
VIRRLVNSVFWLIGFSVVLFVYFTVPVGRYTLFQHTLRIAATEPAQELGRDLSQVGGEMAEEAVEHGERAIEHLREEASQVQEAQANDPRTDDGPE